MSSPSQPSPLVAAVQAFDAELQRFALAAAAACRRSLDSKRELERAAASLKEAAEAERALPERAQALIAALNAAQADQQARTEALRTRAEEIHKRCDEYDALADRYGAIGAEAAGLSTLAQGLGARSKEGDTDAASIASALGEVADKLTSLRDAAKVLGADSRQAGFEELSREAHNVEQTLNSLRNKLTIARDAMSGGSSRSDA